MSAHHNVTDRKPSAAQEAKKQVVAEITEKLKAAKSVVFIDYKGLTVAEDTAFRNEFRKGGCEYKVLKNTLVRRAFNDMGITAFDNDLNGPTAVAFGSDETGASKIIVEACKKFNDKIAIKSAYVDGTYVDVNGVKALANMPSREQLIAKMLGSLQSPITGLASCLSGITRGLVVALNAIAEKKA